MHRCIITVDMHNLYLKWSSMRRLAAKEMTLDMKSRDDGLLKGPRFKLPTSSGLIKSQDVNADMFAVNKFGYVVYKL